MATDDDGAIRVRCQGCATLVLTEVVLRQIRRVVIHDRDDDGRECIGSRYVVEIVQLDDDA